VISDCRHACHAQNQETSMRVGSGIVALVMASLVTTAAAAGARQSVQTIMDAVVDPSADRLWETAGTVVTAQGVRAHGPRTPEQWTQARALALQLVGGAKRLQTRRPVGGNGHWALADASTPGMRTAVQIEADIAKNPQLFYKAAARLERTAQDAADALGRRDLGAFVDAGARIDAACEACHAAYWYPRDPPRPLPDAAAFARSATGP
jgi:hypothetical protein